MIRPGVSECPVTELHGRLQKLLRGYLPEESFIQFCCQKFWDGDLAAFILTEDKAMNAHFTMNDFGSSGDGGCIEVVEFKNIVSVTEENLDVPFPRGEYRLTLTDANNNPRKFYFSFPKKGEAYYKLLELLKAKVGIK